MEERLHQPIVNRVFTLLAMIAIAPALLLLIDLPVRSVAFPVFGAPLRFDFSGDTLLLTLVPAFTIAGVDWVLRDHPAVRRGELPYLFPFWIAPGLGALALALVLTRLESWSLWVAAILAGAFVIGVLIYGEYNLLAPDSPNFAAARLSVLAFTYVVAFALFTVIYGQRERTLLSASFIALVGFLLALELLNPHAIGLARALVNAVIIAFLLGQATWAMNYWNISNWSAGVLLLAIFYVANGISQQYAQGVLTRGVLIEYGLVSALALAVAWVIR